MLKSLLNKKNYGLLELLIASVIILCQYKLGPLPLSFVICPLMVFLAYRRKRKIWGERSFGYLVTYILLHEIVLFVTMTTIPSYHFNHIVEIALYLFALGFVIPALNYKKLITSIVLITVIVSLGILYHFLIIQTGGIVQTIRIPFLPIDQAFGERELLRPTSFFTEPSYYGTFMMVPLFLALIYRKYWLAVVCVGMVFLSTTITGVIGCVGIISFYFVTKKEGKIKSLIIFPTVVAAMGYALMNFGIFGETSAKIENQRANIETVDRVYNGILLFDKMEKQYLILGINNSNCSDYANENHLMGSLIPLFEGSDQIYLPSFWDILYKYGIVGLILYLLVFYRLYKKEKSLLPYIFNAILSMLFAGGGFSSFYLFSMSFLAVFARDYKKEVYLI